MSHVTFSRSQGKNNFGDSKIFEVVMDGPIVNETVARKEKKIF